MTSPSLRQALALFQAGRYDDVARMCGQALEQVPDDANLTTLWAVSLQQTGDAHGAATLYRRLAERAPHVAPHWANLASMLRKSGAFEDADEAYRTALARDGNNADYLVDYGLLLLDMGRIADARHRFLDAVDLQPRNAEAAVYASLACFECGDAQRAAALIPPPDVWPALSVHLREELAAALMQVGRIDEAQALLESLGSQATSTGIVRLAQLNERVNRMSRARELLAQARARAAAPSQQEEIVLLQLEASLAMRDKQYDAARAAADAIVSLQPPPQVEASARFNLATLADKQADPPAAMAHLHRAHAIQYALAETIAPDMADPDAEPLKIASVWLGEHECTFRHDPRAPSAQDSPVFIVGFPRSGTTMLEQMLDAHPGYASMDERATLQRCIERMESRGFDYPHGLDRMDDATADDLRSVYWAEVGKVITLSAGQQLVDKNPLNMLRLPMIMRMFPNAKIILALRHPCDVLLSCYMQNFRSPAFMVLCSSLERLAKSYVNAMRFWIHHQALLAPDTLVLRYEDTVGDFPAQVERIGEFLGIADRAFLAQFSQHAARKGYISTPSYSQVVEPVNTRAVGRWQPYAPWLQPALPILQPVADHWDYDLTVR